MEDIQRHIEVVTHVTANLVARLREVDELRDQIRSVEASAPKRCAEADAAANGAAAKTPLRSTPRW